MSSVTTEQQSTPATREPFGRQGGHNRRGGGRGDGTGGRGRHTGRGRGSGEARGRGGSRRPRGRESNNRQDGEHPQQPNSSNESPLAVAAAPDPPALGPKADADDVASDDDSTICFICADPIKYYAIAPCGHTTCHICSLRMRALYKTKACVHCRTESEFVIFSNNDNKRFEEFDESEIVAQIDALGIKCNDQTVYDDTTVLLRYNCPDPDCDRACLGWSDLQRHSKSEHNRFMCDLCIRHKKVFSHEHTLFTNPELRKHERSGDDQPGSENQSGFKGHPPCGFCSKRFYSSDELYEHCKLVHETCWICERRRPPNAKVQYYINYEALEVHFQKDHYACLDEECIQQKFVVFDNEVDLRAHQLEKHPNGLSKSARRDARRIDMSHFEDARPFQQPRERGRRGRGRGDGNRGQNDMPEQPVRTEQQLSRAEVAYQRQLAVQSAQSTTTRAFGGQLTDPAFAATASPNVPRPAQAEAPPPRPPPPLANGTGQRGPAASAAAFPPLGVPPTAGTNSLPQSSPARPARPSNNSPAQPGPARSSGPPNNQTAQAGPVPAARPNTLDDVRRVRHAAVIERASSMLRQDNVKLNIFRANISMFRAGTISANALIEIFWGLFDVSAADLGKLLNELAELYEDERKRSELLKAWNDWKALNEDYPPIAGASAASSAGVSAGSRVLKIKSSTQTSSRSSTAQSGAWGTAASSTASAPRPPVQNPNRAGKGAHAPTPWVTPAQPSPAITRNVGGPAAKKDEFPSLPAKRTTPGWTPVGKKPSGWDNPGPSVNAWGAGAESSAAADAVDEEPAEGSGKKKGKQKQILFRVGL